MYDKNTKNRSLNIARPQTGYLDKLTVAKRIADGTSYQNALRSVAKWTSSEWTSIREKVITRCGSVPQRVWVSGF